MEAGSRHFDPSTPEERSERETEFARIVAFTDSVFAIAITLLVLQIEVPDRTSDLNQHLVDQLPDLLAYALSFAVIGRFWMLHHRFFATLTRFDTRLIALNMVYLGLLVLVPFTSEVLGDYSESTEAPVLYAALLGLAAMCNWIMVRHALRKDMVHPASRAAQPLGDAFSLTVPGIFFLSIPIAFISPVIAELSWLVLFVVRARIPRRR